MKFGASPQWLPESSRGNYIESIDEAYDRRHAGEVIRAAMTDYEEQFG